MKRAQLDESIAATYEIILERFGEPLGDGEGVPMSTKKRDMGNRGFGAKQEGDDIICDQCGMMTAMDEDGHSCEMGEAHWRVYNAATGEDLGEFDGNDEAQALKQFQHAHDDDELDPHIRAHQSSIAEARTHISSDEIEQTWEDLYLSSGACSVEELSTWLATTPEVVAASLPRHLVVDRNGDIVEKGMSSRPPPPMSFS